MLAYLAVTRSAFALPTVTGTATWCLYSMRCIGNSTDRGELQKKKKPRGVACLALVPVVRVQGSYITERFEGRNGKLPSPK